MTNGEQQPPPPAYAPQQYVPEPKGELADHFIGKGKLSLFLILGALCLFVGVLFLNLIFSGLLEGDTRAISFLGNLLFDLGFIAIITLLFLAGIMREDIADNARGHMIRAAGFGLGIYILVWMVRIASGLFNPYYF
jgi:hypothetical protein